MNNKGLSKDDSLCIKGIAILMLIFHHLYCEVSRFEKFDVDFSPFTQDFVFDISNIMRICVSIFAFITGYGLLKSIAKTDIDRKSVAKWNITRLFKTMSGYYFVFMIYLIVTEIINQYPQEVYFKNGISKGIVYIIIDFLGLGNLFGTPMGLATWWYMSTVVVFILLVPIIYAVSKKIGYLPIVAIIIALPRILNLGYLGGMNLYTFLLVMVFGMIFSDYDMFEKISAKLPKNKILSFLISLVFFGGISIGIYHILTRIDTAKFWEIKYTLLPIFVICLFRYCIIRIPVLKNLLAFLGKYSMTIFLTHNFIRYVYLNDFTYSFGNFMLIFIVLTVLSVVLAVVIDTLKKAVKYDKLINKFTAFILKKADNIIK